MKTITKSAGCYFSIKHWRSFRLAPAALLAALAWAATASALAANPSPQTDAAFSDADWVSLNPFSPGANGGIEAVAECVAIDITRHHDIIAFCRANLAHYKAPKHVVFGPLPKTSTGKIQKFLLRQRAKGPV